MWKEREILCDNYFMNHNNLFRRNLFVNTVLNSEVPSRNVKFQSLSVGLVDCYRLVGRMYERPHTIPT